MRWQRLDAEHWLHVWGMVATTLLVVWALMALLGGFASGAPAFAVVPAALAALSGWLTSAWRRERPWAWWVWTVGSAAGILTALNALADGRALAAVLLVASGISVLLLFHPDSRARIETSPSVVPRGPLRGTRAGDTRGGTGRRSRPSTMIAGEPHSLEAGR